MKTDLAIKHIVRQMEMDEHRELKDLTPTFFKKSNIKWGVFFLKGNISSFSFFFFFSSKAGMTRRQR